MSSAARRAAATVALVVAGVAVRCVLLQIAPQYGFTGDHVDYVCWGRQTERDGGVLDLYRTPPGTCDADLRIDGRWQRVSSGTNERLNYPPLASYAFWLAARIHARLDPARVANTVAARAAYAVTTTLAELACAIGVAVLVGGFAGPWAAIAAFGATWLAPPLLVDGPFWGQTESWVLAPAVWMLAAMVRERWLAAGIAWGVALAWKPSALLFAPVWLYALLFRTPRARVVLGAVAALVAVNALALPFWLDSGAAWLQSSYLDNFVYRIHWTTAMAFNVWYVDLLATGILDPRQPLLGVSRDAWGTALLAGGLGLAFLVSRRWERSHPARAAYGMVPLATLVTLAAVMLPTRVHSTYGAFTAPFLIATMFLVPRTTVAALACLATITLQILSWQWGTLLAMHVLPDESVFPPARRAQRAAMRAHDVPREWALTVANLAAAAGVAGAVAWSARRGERRP